MVPRTTFNGENLKISPQFGAFFANTFGASENKLSKRVYVGRFEDACSGSVLVCYVSACAATGFTDRSVRVGQRLQYSLGGGAEIAGVDIEGVAKQQ